MQLFFKPFSLDIGNSFGISDRLFLDDSLQFQVKNSLFHRILEFFHIAPESYKEENRKILTVFQNAMITQVGLDRFERACKKFTIDFESLKAEGKSLVSKDVAKLITAFKDVTVEDMQEALEAVRVRKAWITDFFPADLSNELSQVPSIQYLTPTQFEKMHFYLSKPFLNLKCSDLKHRINSEQTFYIARIFFDLLLSIRERLQLCESNHRLIKEEFFEHLEKLIIKRDMDVGTLIPAYKQQNGEKAFYRVAARLVTTKGQISFVLLPAAKTMNIPPIRVFRGSDFWPAGLDSLSHWITDTEVNLGERAYLSGKIYERFLKRLGRIPVYLGFSLGGNQVQRHLAENLDIDEAYLYCTPGVPSSVIKSYNSNIKSKDNLQKIHIHIIKRDMVPNFGGKIVGYKAPKNVEVDIKLMHQSSKDLLAPHNAFFCDGRAGYFGIESINPNQRDRFLRSYYDSGWEKIRKVVGGYFFSPLMTKIGSVFRKIFPSRAQKVRGLFIERFQGSEYKIEHITKEMAITG